MKSTAIWASFFMYNLLRDHLICCANAEIQTFSVTGLENCVFNFVFYFSLQDLTSKDLFEHFIVSNQHQQLQTVFDGSLPLINSILIPQRYMEACSVNILHENLSRCSRRSIVYLFGSRLYNPTSILYIIQGKKSGCGGDRESIASRFFGHISAVIVVVQLTPETQDVDRSEVHCLSCVGGRVDPLPVEFTNILRVIEISTQSQLNSLEQSILAMSPYSGLILETDKVKRRCGSHSHAYRKTFQQQPLKTICDPTHIFIETVAATMNKSVDYVDNIEYFDVLIYNRKPGYAAIVGLGITFWETWAGFISPDKMMKQILQDKQMGKFCYCTKTETREGFNFLFWTIPFDSWSWALLGISVLSITGILRGQWFDLVSILMRQEVRVLTGKRKFLIIFILATIVFTYGYEGVISSFLTVQPPVIVYKRLKDLFEDGYKLIQYDGWESYHLIPIFEKENITGSRNDKSLTITMPFNNLTQIISRVLTAECLTTYSIRSFAVDFWKSEMRQIFPKARCHVARDTNYFVDRIFHLFGPSHLQVARAGELIIQSGILDMYYENLGHSWNIKWKKKMVEIKREDIWRPFLISDWKILSIFIGWSCILSFTVMIFLFELVRVWKPSCNF